MPMIQDFQAILFDVDNTLSNTRKGISIATRQAIEQLQSQKYLAVCTGRIYASLTRYVFPFFPPDAVHIISGGGQIVRTDGEVLWEKSIPGDTAQRLCQQLMELNAEFFLSHDRKMFITPAFQQHLTKGTIPITFGNFEDLQNWETPLISVLDITPEIRAVIQTFPKLSWKEMKRSVSGTYMDITAAGVNKATALAKWSELTKIELSKTIGIGDSSNDLEFLEKIGFSVAMGNATAEIKALAQRTIGHTDQDGLAVYLQQISQGAEL